MQTVSIIVPIYNTERYLKQCVDSLLLQTYKDISIVLVDDGSTDDSGRICDEYVLQDTRIHVIHKQNGGLSSARNIGMDYVLDNRSSKWIMFVDSDDYIDVNLVDQVVFMTKNTSADIVCFEMLKVFKEKCVPYIVYPKEKLLQGEEKFSILFGENNPGDYMCNKLFNASLFQDIRFPLNKNYEDMYVSHLLLEKAQIVSICKGVNYYYRQLSNSISNSKNNVEKFNNLLDASYNQYIWFNVNHHQYSNQSFASNIMAHAKVLVVIYDRKNFIKDVKILKRTIRWVKKNKKEIKNNIFVNSYHNDICLRASHGFIIWIILSLLEKVKRIKNLLYVKMIK